MEKNNKNVILIILILLVILLGGYIVYDKVLPVDKMENNNIDSVVDDDSINNNIDSVVDDDSINNDIVDGTNNFNEELVSIGLNLYKLFTGNGTGPFKWEDGKVINYVDVITLITQDYFDSSSNEKGFSIPYKDGETGEWKSYGGFGTDKQSKFKSISIEKQEENTVTFKITYQYTQMGTQTADPIEDFSTFVIKKVDGIWKVDKFQLIYDLKF